MFPGLGGRSVNLFGGLGPAARILGIEGGWRR